MPNAVVLMLCRSYFHGMLQRDTHSWNGMIGGHATHGRGKEALEQFSQMQITGDSKPDNVRLMAVLCACACTVADAEILFRLVKR